MEGGGVLSVLSSLVSLPPTVRLSNSPYRGGCIGGLNRLFEVDFIVPGGVDYTVPEEKVYRVRASPSKMFDPPPYKGESVQNLPLHVN